MQSCDVFITNLRPDSLARLGFDAPACRAMKPALIHCIITGFGPGGPYRGRPAYDTVLQAASGLAGLTIERDGAPSFAPFLAADHVVAEIAAGAIAAALVRRFRTGEGATIEIPMHETMAAFVLQEHLGPATFDPPLGPPGDRRVLDPNARPIATQDGWIAITANTDAQAKVFLKAVGRADLDRRSAVLVGGGAREELQRLVPPAGRIDRVRARPRIGSSCLPSSISRRCPATRSETSPTIPHLTAVKLVEQRRASHRRVR